MYKGLIGGLRIDHLTPTSRSYRKVKIRFLSSITIQYVNMAFPAFDRRVICYCVSKFSMCSALGPMYLSMCLILFLSYPS